MNLPPRMEAKDYVFHVWTWESIIRGLVSAALRCGRGFLAARKFRRFMMSHSMSGDIISSFRLDFPAATRARCANRGDIFFFFVSVCSCQRHCEDYKTIQRRAALCSCADHLYLARFVLLHRLPNLPGRRLFRRGRAGFLQGRLTSFRKSSVTSQYACFAFFIWSVTFFILRFARARSSAGVF